MSKTRIIIVDDHQLIIEGLTSLLAHSHFEVAATFNSAGEALDYISAESADVQIVISDIAMPGMSGIELCRNIKANFSSIYVLMLSMYSSNEAVHEALMAEADGFIVKHSTTDFLTALNKLQKGGTYFSEELLPRLYRGIQKDSSRPANADCLSHREKEILSLIAQELTSDEIAGKLFISKKTVDNHRTNMLAKTNSKSTIGLIKYALQQDLLRF